MQLNISQIALKVIIKGHENDFNFSLEEVPRYLLKQKIGEKICGSYFELILLMVLLL